MRLINSPLRYSIAVTPRVNAILAAGCYCGTEEAAVTRRLVGNGTVQIHIQCAACGRSLGGALSRADFYGWQDYPEWDALLADRWRDQRMTVFEQERIARLDEREQRQADYHAWLLASPEWRELRARVLHRAGYRCEACLNASATEVHHETYALGRLPPAFLLRAVCAACHDRLHGWEV